MGHKHHHHHRKRHHINFKKIARKAKEPINSPAKRRALLIAQAKNAAGITPAGTSAYHQALRIKEGKAPKKPTKRGAFRLARASAKNVVASPVEVAVGQAAVHAARAAGVPIPKIKSPKVKGMP